MEYQLTMIGGCVVLNHSNQLLEKNPMKFCQVSIDPTSTTAVNLPSMINCSWIDHVVYHGKYTYNFARPNANLQKTTLISEIQLASQLNADIVIHQGKNVASEGMSKIEAIGNYVENLSSIAEEIPNNCCVLLENSAGQGTEMGYTLKELSFIFRRFDDSIKPKFGICLDTCHAFAAGDLDCRDQHNVEQYLEDFNRLIGIDKLKCIHFNDSSVSFGHKRDIHGDLMCGYITNHLLGGNTSGMAYLSQYATKHNIPMILETPCKLGNDQSKVQYEIVKDMIEGFSELDTKYDTYCQQGRLTVS